MRALNAGAGPRNEFYELNTPRHVVVWFDPAVKYSTPSIARAAPEKRSAGSEVSASHVLASGSYASTLRAAAPWSVSPPAMMMRPFRTNVEEEMCETVDGIDARAVQLPGDAGSQTCT